MNKLLIEKKQGKTCLALLKEGELYDYIELNDDEDSLRLGDIFIAKVIRVVKGLNACFVRLDKANDAFMHMKVPHRPGDMLCVQIARPAFDKKQALVKEELELKGNYVILSDKSSGVSFSKSFLDEAKKNELKELFESGFHILFRSRAEKASYADIKKELDELIITLKNLKNNKSLDPKKLFSAENIQAALIESFKEKIDLVISNIRGFELEGAESIYKESDIITDSVKKELKLALRRRIQLKSGIELVFDAAEALTVVDINTAKGRTKGDAAFEANKEAVLQIARLLRLRGTAGIVIVDCIDIDDKQKRAQILSVFEQALREDRVKTTVHGFTRLGLIELTRQRIDERKDAENNRCPYCQGSGIYIAEDIDGKKADTDWR